MTHHTNTYRGRSQGADKDSNSLHCRLVCMVIADSAVVVTDRSRSMILHSQDPVCAKDMTDVTQKYWKHVLAKELLGQQIRHAPEFALLSTSITPLVESCFLSYSS